MGFGHEFWILLTVFAVTFTALGVALFDLFGPGPMHTCWFTNCDMHYQGEQYRGPHRTTTARRKHYER